MLKKLILLLFFLFVPGWAQPSLDSTLYLERAQEGDPGKPRALILIHDGLEGRPSFAPFLKVWADRDRGWARTQYCSVYTYEYRNNGLYHLPSSREIAEDLATRIARHRVVEPAPDEVNPKPKAHPYDGRQPSPYLGRSRTEIILAGVGYGGLVARELAPLLQQSGYRVSRVAFLSTPLDGTPTIRLVQTLNLSERRAALGLGMPDFNKLSAGWWSLAELFLQSQLSSGRKPYELPGTKVLVASSDRTVPFHPTENVLYGRGRKVSARRADDNGLYTVLSMLGLSTGGEGWERKFHFEELPPGKINEDCVRFLLEQLIDREVTWEYLWRRHNIEQYIRGDGELLPLYIYWDERDTKYVAPQWREAYASRRGLYEMMWL